MERDLCRLSLMMMIRQNFFSGEEAKLEKCIDYLRTLVDVSACLPGHPVRSAHYSFLVEQSVPLLSLQDAISLPFCREMVSLVEEKEKEKGAEKKRRKKKNI